MPGLEPIGEDLWLAEGEPVSFFGFACPTRSVVARLPDRRVWIWSPVGLAEDLRSEVEALGEITDLVSPNKLHHLFLAQWKAAYPSARLWGPKSAIARFPTLDFAGALTDDPPAEWRAEFDQAWFRGSLAMDEIMFFHHRSRTAIVADLIQAFEGAFLRRRWPRWMRALARLDGITAANPGAPREWRLSFVRRAPARLARAKALSWNPEQVVIAHGRWARADGRAFLERALAWLGSTPPA